MIDVVFVVILSCYTITIATLTFFLGDSGVYKVAAGQVKPPEKPHALLIPEVVLSTILRNIYCLIGSAQILTIFYLFSD